MIVVNPDQVIWSIATDDRLAEDSVRFGVGLPILGVEFQLRRKIVKYRPERLVGVAFIESCRNPLRQTYGETVVVFGPIRKNRLSLLACFCVAISGPSDPVSAGFPSSGFIALARPPELRTVRQPSFVFCSVSGRRFETTISRAFALGFIPRKLGTACKLIWSTFSVLVERWRSTRA